MMTESEKIAKVRMLTLALMLALLLAVYSYHKANAQEYNNWVDQLRNQNDNVCCFDGDGRRLQNVDWDNLGKYQPEPTGTSGYRVFEDGKIYDVPNWAIVKGRNQDGIARAWFDRESHGGGPVIKKVRCFLKGLES